MFSRVAISLSCVRETNYCILTGPNNYSNTRGTFVFCYGIVYTTTVYCHDTFAQSNAFWMAVKNHVHSKFDVIPFQYSLAVHSGEPEGSLNIRDMFGLFIHYFVSDQSKTSCCLLMVFFFASKVTLSLLVSGRKGIAHINKTHLKLRWG